MDKTKIRKRIIDIRSGLKTDELNKMSNTIFENLKAANILEYSNILVYSDFKNEVKTGDIIEFLLNENKSVYLPVCNLKKHTMSVSKIDSNSFEFKVNAYGISEPTENEGDCKAIDCAIVPGVAFGENGARVGFGGGYYDRFFSENNNILKIGLCCEFQLLKNIEMQKHDVPMDLIVTEKRIVKCRKNKLFI